MSANGKCLACGIGGKRKKNFICVDCGGVDKIIHVCSRCGDKTDLSRFGTEELTGLELLLGQPLVEGMTIVSSFCNECKEEDDTGEINIRIFRISKGGIKEEGASKITAFPSL